MRFCYADPPYPGQAKRYKHDPRHAEVDPVELMLRLEEEFPDGWAMSSHTPALRMIAGSMPPRTRIAAWCKPNANGRPTVYPQYSWEPVVFRPAPYSKPESRWPKDFLLASPQLNNFMGAKPPEFCYWIFDMLGARQGDELVDMFPGTGAVTQAWRFYQATIAPPALQEKA